MTQIEGWLYYIDTVPSSDWNWYCTLYAHCVTFCFAVSLFITPSSTPLICTSVFMPRLYLLDHGVPSVLPDWCARLQICMSETLLFRHFSSCFSSERSSTIFAFSQSAALLSPFLAHTYCCHTVCHFTVWFGFSFLIVFFYCVVLCLFGLCVCSTPGCSGEHHEGEDAEERREVVVLLERQKQRI